MSFQFLFKKLSSLSFLKVITLIFGVLSTIQLTTQLAASEFGLYCLAMSFCLIISVFVKQGLDNSLLKIASALNGAQRGRVYYQVLLAAFFFSIPLLITIHSLKEFIFLEILGHAELIHLIGWVSTAVIFFTFNTINCSLLTAYGKAGISIFFSGLLPNFLLLMILLNSELTSAYQAFGIYSISVVFNCICSFLMTLSTLASDRGLEKAKNNSVSFSKIISINLSFFVLALCALVNQQLPSLLLGKYVSLAELAEFTLALKVVMLMSVPLIAMNSYTAPLFSRLYSEKKIHDLKSLFRLSQKLLMLIAMVSGACLWFAAETVLGIFGDEYLGAESYVKVLLIGQIVNLSCGSVVSILTMTGFHKLHLKNTIIISSISFLLLLYFIPIGGALAASYITSIALAAINFISLFFVFKKVLASNR
ncbi:oligosaccharide flippase family protein [Catenovulum sp. SM1970]|uniref:lipopolysaccharide biosynthesis protein n=1 Tax=Marinifaba aquimaris TaxID=2741323 RepID=UPI001573984B|nr:oligosaccharide flippase family protein [Marinifaba aquimaris]NTS76905.1 oligosaccharide flippase family protein [Marinifaba aquimaris]